MGEIAVFVPNEEMYRQARALADGGGYHVRVLKKVQTENVVNEARDAISQEDVQIIVARGKQAALIKRYTKVTLAEIKITAQELGLLILRAKKIINKPTPHIAVFGWGEMLCDTTYFDTLYGIQLKRYIFEDDEKCFDIMENACGEKPDLVIGGLQVQEFAAYRGIPFLSFISTDESIKTALDNAESLYHMSEMEQFNYAQVSTILDSSNNGIIKLTPAGTVLLMNPAMEHMLGQSQMKKIGDTDFTMRRRYLESLKKVRDEKVDIFMGNHTANNDLMAKRAYMQEHPEENPFLDGEAWGTYLDRRRDELLSTFCVFPKE